MQQRVEDRGSPAPAAESAVESLQLSVAIVGVCGCGKNLLAAALRKLGYNAYPVDQEHSSVNGLFRHRNPDVVIFLDANDVTVAERKQAKCDPEQLNIQRERLRLAREKADIRICTDSFTPAQLLSVARQALEIRF